ncbi:MAG: imidazolonepropionase [Bacteroidia bacterium]|jgi:imidazolonepropionase|nr:imidazolonepropionase [Bacteroidia bacterium]
MNDLLITDIKSLIGILPPEVQLLKGKEMQHTETLENAWLYAQDELIVDFGLGDAPSAYLSATTCINAKGKLVLPSYIDSHSHIVFAATREEEFVMRIKGKTYEEIAAAGGGILNSAAKLQKLSEDELFASAYERLFEVIFQGTGALEIKSGYGLTVADELKMLRVIKRLQEVSPIPIKATFLGAHAIPTAYKNNREGYIELIINEMLPAVAMHELANYCDVFCDQGFFTPNETLRILKAAAAHGLRAKIHGNELGYTGGVQAAVEAGALSVDHLEYTSDAEIACLLQSTTMPVALPGCSFFLGIPYAPVRKMIDAGLPVCLASDYNPGSTPNGRMGFVFSLACTQMKLTPEEAFNAITINGAHALELSNELGSITKGKKANLIITKEVPSLAYLPYHFGSDAIDQIILNGKPLVRLS